MNKDDSTFHPPRVVYNMRANSSGDIVELLSPIFKSKYGDIFDSPSGDYLGDNIDVVNKLISVGVYADSIGNDELYASKEGVNIQIELVDGRAKVINIYNQILFLLKGMRVEQEQLFKRAIKNTIERIGN